MAGPYVVAGVCLALAALVLVLFLRPDPYRLVSTPARWYAGRSCEKGSHT